MFAEIGLNLDLSVFQPGMSDEELAATAARMTDEVKRQNEAAQSRAAEGRTTKQQTRVRRSEARRKVSLGAVYRRLAKSLHPDLERDPERRSAKEALMQEVTAAYANHDLHMLLRLELAWMHREEAGSAQLADETLRGYNEVLKEQVAELEVAIEELAFHPRYEPLIEDAGAFGVRLQCDGPAQARRLDELVTSLRGALARLRMPGALEEVRGAIRERRRTQRTRY